MELLLELPYDTIDGFNRSLDYALEHDVNINVFNLVAYPGSAYHAERESYGLEMADGTMPFVIATSTFSRDEMDRARERVRDISAQLARSGRPHVLRMEGPEGSHADAAGPRHAATVLGGSGT